MAGLDHGHAADSLGRYRNRADINLVGFAEPDRDVATRYTKLFRLPPSADVAEGSDDETGPPPSRPGAPK
jgi:hypothetical protein